MLYGWLGVLTVGYLSLWDRLYPRLENGVRWHAKTRAGGVEVFQTVKASQCYR